MRSLIAFIKDMIGVWQYLELDEYIWRLRCAIFCRRNLMRDENGQHASCKKHYWGWWIE